MIADDAVSLERLGWFAHHDRPPVLADGTGVSRVVVEHRGAYELVGPHGSLEAAVDPSLRDEAVDPRDFPAVGDWVTHSLEAQHDRRVGIVGVHPRRSEVVRRAPGHEPLPQLVAANVDTMCVVTTPDEDLNERRLERYLVTALGSGADALVVLNKTDLGGEEEAISRLATLAGGVEVLATSVVTGRGLAELARRASGGQTVAFTGSSGVGKSSLINSLLGGDVLEIGDVRDDGRGRHTTIRRELLLVPSGGVVIDTPGLREIQLWDDGGLELGFPDIAALGEQCRFADCRHLSEPKCAVRAAAERGEVPAARLESYLDLAAELAQLDDDLEEHARVRRRRRDARRRDAPKVADELAAEAEPPAT